MRQFNKSFLYRSLTAIAVLTTGIVAAHADYDSSNTDYDAAFLQDSFAFNVGYQFSNTEIPLDHLNLQDFTGDTPLPTGGGSETVSTSLDWSANINGSMVTGTGNMSTLVTDMGGGVYSQQVTGLLLQSTDGMDKIRLHGTQDVGQEVVTPDGGGVFHIQSFFDVFTEISLDGGGTWGTANQGTYGGDIPLSPSGSPEPLTIGLALAGLGIAARRRRS